MTLKPANGGTEVEFSGKLFPYHSTPGASTSVGLRKPGHSQDLCNRPSDPTGSRVSGGSFTRRGSEKKTDKEHHHKGGVFVDAESMKEKVRANLMKQKHNVKDYYKKTGFWSAIATSYYFEIITLGVIAMNSVWIAIDTDLNDAEILLNAHWVFQVAENFFCLFFFFEWGARFMAFQRKRDSLKDAWFVFDSGLVFMMVSETWIMTGITLLAGTGSGGGAGNTSVLRIARLLRLSRMARMARLLRAMPELMILIKGMMAASRSVVFTLLLLLILMYVFAIAMTQLLAESDIGKERFSTVLQSMYTLWLHGTLLDDINWLQKRLSTDSVPCTVLFFLFVLLAAMTVMNMLIGVLCEVVSAVAATEKEESQITYVKDKLREVVELLDQNSDMSISKGEFLQILENQEACRCLEDVGVDVIGLVDSVDAIFAATNDWRGGGADETLDFPKFMEVVLQLRGSNNATVKDVVDLKKFVRDAIHHTNKALMDIQEELRRNHDLLVLHQKASLVQVSRKHSQIISDRCSSIMKDPIAGPLDMAINLEEVSLAEANDDDSDHLPTPNFMTSFSCEQLEPQKTNGTSGVGHDVFMENPKTRSRGEVGKRVAIRRSGEELDLTDHHDAYRISREAHSHPATSRLKDELEDEVIHMGKPSGSWWTCSASASRGRTPEEASNGRQRQACCAASPSQRWRSKDPEDLYRDDSRRALVGQAALLAELDLSAHHKDKLVTIQTKRSLQDVGANGWRLDGQDIQPVVARASQALLAALKDMQLMQKMTTHVHSSDSPARPSRHGGEREEELSLRELPDARGKHHRVTPSPRLQ